MWIRSDRIIGSRDAWHVIGADQSYVLHMCRCRSIMSGGPSPSAHIAANAVMAV
jgi:hypothetical protein